MTIHERLVADVALIHISGKVTLTDGTAELDAALQRLTGQGRLKLILDFGDVPYIDSTALGILLRAHATLTRRGGALRLVRVHGHVRELLELTRLLAVFDVFDTEPQALASVDSTSPPRA